MLPPPFTQGRLIWFEKLYNSQSRLGRKALGLRLPTEHSAVGLTPQLRLGLASSGYGYKRRTASFAERLRTHCAKEAVSLWLTGGLLPFGTNDEKLYKQSIPPRPISTRLYVKTIKSIKIEFFPQRCICGQNKTKKFFQGEKK